MVFCFSMKPGYPAVGEFRGCPCFITIEIWYCGIRPVSLVGLRHLASLVWSYRGVGCSRKVFQTFFCPLPNHIVLRSLITRTILPGPTISTSFSCQLRSTLIACPPPSPGPLDDICEKPVPCGDSFFDEAAVGCEPCDMPLYLLEPYFPKVSPEANGL